MTGKPDSSATDQHEGWQTALRRIEEARKSGVNALNLSDLGLTSVPDSLVQLAGLRLLSLSNNQLTALPDALAQLSNLQILSLANNQLTALPDALAQLSNLQNLSLDNNQLTALPNALAQLSNLQSLSLDNNQLTALPDALAQLSNLQNLSLANNQLTALPDALAQLSKLTELYLHGNTALGLPDEILGPTFSEVYGSGRGKRARPPQEILTYYFSQRADARPLNEAKLILVGQGAVGKTSLIKALTTGKFNSREKTTEGIKISDWSCPLGRSARVLLHIWDFGGQEMMHATHQFFLTARSLYLLVLNRRTGGVDREADHWFRLIRAFGGKDAPVLVVLNKQKAEPFDVNRSAWLEKYAENIRGFVETDCADAKTITQLKRKLQEQIGQSKDVKANFPLRWFSIKDALSRMATDFVTFSDYRKICEENGEKDPAQQTLLAGFLHDLGIALNYKEDPRLRFAYVLKPEWVTQGIYALLHAFVKSGGLFTRGEAEKTLAAKGYSAEAVDFLLGLMEQFELSFPLGDRQNRILIPELLEDQQPDFARQFDPAQCLNSGYQYPVVPEGLLPRFIVRTHHLSSEATRWKSGVILQHDPTGCRALVRTDTAENQVRIHIDGPEAARRELLAIIRYNLAVIHSDYESRPVELAYPAPDKPVSLRDLQALQKAGELTVPVVRADQTIIKVEIAPLTAPSPSPLRLFLSYSHADEKYINELRKDLKLMERNGLIRPWYDRALSAGEKWEPRILQELNMADIIVCQISRDFLFSDFCMLTELDTALKRKEAGEAELIAYVLKDSGWKETKLKYFQILPKDAKPLADWRDKDKYWRAIAEGIQTVVKQLQQRPPRERPGEFRQFM
jgi:internalin A